jgi:hypothetical protein
MPSNEGGGGPAPRLAGTVRRFNAKKGFGFLAPDGEGDEDLFVHQVRRGRSARAAAPGGARRPRY